MSSILITRSCKTAYGGFFLYFGNFFMYLQYFIVLSAEGFEEGKSLLTIDILRRAGIARVSSIKDREINGCDGISAIAL